MGTSLRQHDQHTFLSLPENRLAIRAIQRISPLTRRRTIQIVSLFGPPGVGKSRLCRELIRSWETKRSDGKLIYTTASEFAAQLAEASSGGAVPQFQQRFRKDVKLLICEDLQSLAGRTETQQQLTAAIDDVTLTGGCVLFTATRRPAEIRFLNSRLTNRIHGGLCVDLPLPSVESRRKLLEHFLSTVSLRLSAQEISLIAEKHEVSPRELESILLHIKTLQNSTVQSLTVQDLLEEIPAPREHSIQQIAAAAAREYGVKVADLRSPSRSKTISTARHVAMHLARTLTDLNYKQIGTYFGRSNHSTVIHACNKISELIAQDAILSHQVDSIVNRIRSR